jgi:hypothetical protein
MEKYTEEETKVFEFLDALRESGVTNMYLAAPYIQREFSMEYVESRHLLAKWMETFPFRHPTGR